jgi:5-methyltetrahydrofolate corrinoid/iron sulfur protein methyltransferase
VKLIFFPEKILNRKYFRSSETSHTGSINVIVIGELLNSTRKRIRQAISEREADYIMEIAKSQEAAGAAFLDVNAGALGERELECLDWLIRVIREATNMPLCIDSPKPEALALGCELARNGHGNKNMIINSISAETERYKAVLPIVKKYNAGVVALAMDDSGLTEDVDKMYTVACNLIENLIKDGVAPEKIYLDPLIRPISTNSIYGKIVLDLLKRISSQFPEIHKTCGLSNISFGLPKRKVLNRSFVLMAMTHGLDSAIIDPLDKTMMSQIKAVEALLGIDDYCMNYINASRSGDLN